MEGISLRLRTHYETLGLSKTCSAKEVKTAYYKLCKEYHPDKRSNDPKQHKRFVAINEAYNVLRMPDSRRSYDSALRNNWNRPYSENTASQRPPVWRDETIWHMRNRTWEEYHKNEPSTGTNIRTTKSNAVLGCLLLIGIGCLLHLVAYVIAVHISAKRMDLMKGKIEYYNTIQKNAVNYYAKKQSLEKELNETRNTEDIYGNEPRSNQSNQELEYRY